MNTASHGPLGISQPAILRMVAQALDGSSEFIMVLQPSDDGWVIAGANPAFTALYGEALPALIGRSLASLSAIDSPPPELVAIEKAADTGAELRVDLPCHTSTGSPLWLALHVLPSRNRRCVILGHDITASKHAQQERLLAQTLADKLLHAIDVAVVVLTMNGEIVRSNPKLARLLDRHMHSLQGQNFADLVAPVDQPLLAHISGGGISRQPNPAQHVRLVGQDGNWATVLLNDAVVAADDGQHFRILTLIEPQEPTERFQEAGRLRLISLDDIRASLGARWPALRERALSAAAHLLQRKLGPKDSFTRTRDDDFLVCFADLPEEAASFRASVLGRDIRTRLVGQKEGLEAPIVEVSKPAPATESRAPHEVLNARLTARRLEAEAQARESLAALMSTAICHLIPVLGRDAHKVVAYYAKLPQRFQRNMATAVSALPPAERFGYDIDCLTLRLAGQQGLELTLDGGPGHMFVDIRFDVFQSRAATDVLLDACRKIDPAVRQGLVIILTHVPPGLTSSRMLDCVHRLRPFCRAVGFELNEPELPSFDFALASSPILVINADRIIPSSGQTTKLEKLRLQLQTMRCRLMVRHITGRALADRVLGLGIDFITMAE